MKNGIILLLAVFIFACGSSSSEDKDGPTDQEHSDAIGASSLKDNDGQAAQQLWDAMHIDSYTFEYKETGFSPISDLVWEVQVADGAVIYVNYVGEGTPQVELSIETAPTIDELFITVTACEVNANCEVTSIEYDEDYYYPSKYSSSYGEEGSGFEVSGFVVQ